MAACKLVEDWAEPDVRAEGVWPPIVVPRGAHVVYRLYDGEELVYVGYSSDLLTRLLSHGRSKRFDRWRAERYATAQQARWAESSWLEWHMGSLGRLPRYNRSVYG